MKNPGYKAKNHQKEQDIEWVNKEFDHFDIDNLKTNKVMLRIKH